MSAKYEKNVYLAMLAEQCNRFEEMTEFLEQMLKSREKDLNSDERNLLSIAYKNSVTSRRTALRTIIAYEMKEKKKDNSTFLPYIQEYRKKIEEELSKWCKQVISVIDNFLLKRAEDTEAKVFYLKMKGDYNRYNAEYAQGDVKQQIGTAAEEAYSAASEEAKKLPAINAISLGLALNFSVFHYEVKGNHEVACQIAKNTLDAANKELPNNVDEDDEQYRDAMSIINLLKENLEMWKIEGEEGEN
jgi:14-3-3 protein epsilon